MLPCTDITKVITVHMVLIWVMTVHNLSGGHQCLPWRWQQYVPPKQIRAHSVIIQKIQVQVFWVVLCC